jgi:hypothetical protein
VVYDGGNRPKNIRLVVYGSLTLLFMLRTISQMFAEVRPFDWLMLSVEVLVLLLIAYEIWVGIRERRKSRKRQLELQDVLRHLNRFMDAGKALQGRVPDTANLSRQDFPLGSIDRWVSSVKQWREDVKTFLSARSPRALSAFVLITNAESVDSTVHPPSDWPVIVTGELLRDIYQPLVVYLRNLQNIMEKIDTYF